MTFNRMHRAAVQCADTAMTGWDFFRRPVSLRGSDSRRVGTQPQGSMLTLFHHPFCPHSRFVRLALGRARARAPRLIEERVWERRQEFLTLNPAGTTPVLVDEGYPPVPGAAIIAEFLDETQRRRAAASAGCCRPTPASGSRCAGSPPGSTRNSSPRSRALWCRSASTSGSCASSRAAARPTPTRSVRRGSISAIIWPISAGWCAPATGSPATS